MTLLSLGENLLIAFKDNKSINHQLFLYPAHWPGYVLILWPPQTAEIGGLRFLETLTICV